MPLVYIDNTILAGCRKHNRKEQENLYKRVFPFLLPVAMRYLRNRDDAADMFNRAMLKAFTKIDTFNGDSSNLYGWLKLILVRECLDFLKAAKRFQTTTTAVLAETLPNGNGDEAAMDSESILNLLPRLPSLTSAVFNLFVIEGYAHKEISEMLDITETNSKWHLHSARKQLQEMIIKEDLL